MLSKHSTATLVLELLKQRCLPTSLSSLSTPGDQAPTKRKRAAGLAEKKEATMFGQPANSPFRQASPSGASTMFGQPSTGFNFTGTGTTGSNEGLEKKPSFTFLSAKADNNAETKSAASSPFASPKTLGNGF